MITQPRLAHAGRVLKPLAVVLPDRLVAAGLAAAPAVATRLRAVGRVLLAALVVPASRAEPALLPQGRGAAFFSPVPDFGRVGAFAHVQIEAAVGVDREHLGRNPLVEGRRVVLDCLADVEARCAPPAWLWSLAMVPMHMDPVRHDWSAVQRWLLLCSASSAVFSSCAARSRCQRARSCTRERWRGVS